MKKMAILFPVLFIYCYPAIAAEKYEIEVSHNDEFFLINHEKFSAKTFCFNINEGDRVIFVEGSPNGACASATFYDVNTRKTCEVWCE